MHFITGRSYNGSCRHNKEFDLAKRRLFRFETKHDRVLHHREFVKRLGNHFLLASGLVAASLLAGMVGYHVLEGMPWIDAFANAAMILSGMGPLEPLKTTGGKLFAGCYALYSGLLLIVATGIILAPLLHRMLHVFHVESEPSPGEHDRRGG